MFYPVPEVNWRSIYMCGDHSKAFMRKLRDSFTMHLWNEHSQMMDLEDMSLKCPLIELASKHCPLTYHRELRPQLASEKPQLTVQELKMILNWKLKQQNHD